MNLLLDGLPETVEIDGKEISITTDFRTGILFEELMLDDTLSDEEKILTAVELYFTDGIEAESLPEAVDKLIWFYRCGNSSESEKKGDSSSSSDVPPYSFEYDADYIYAAFLGSYGIDLARTSLHWWQFRALFRSLPEDTQFMKIVGYRSADEKTLSKLSKEQRQHYRKMKELYALPKSEDQKQLETDLTELLMNGGNPSSLL